MRKELNISRNEIWISRNLTFGYVTHVKRASTKYSILSFNKIFSDYDEIKNAQKINENEMIKFPNNISIPNYSKISTTSSYSKILLIFSPSRSNTPSRPQLEHIICSNQFPTCYNLQRTAVISGTNRLEFDTFKTTNRGL